MLVDAQTRLNLRLLFGFDELRFVQQVTNLGFKLVVWDVCYRVIKNRNNNVAGCVYLFKLKPDYLKNSSSDAISSDC